ncbi:hypothetical protein Syun_023316 [Stephania yunnanensis]|uniref:Uncharacterized protein n=1 Tax=Stephania yunnanensis TaxID=152371 RepID=A0AAP0F8Q5_9MAGN
MRKTRSTIKYASVARWWHRVYKGHGYDIVVAPRVQWHGAVIVPCPLNLCHTISYATLDIPQKSYFGQRVRFCGLWEAREETDEEPSPQSENALGTQSPRTFTRRFSHFPQYKFLAPFPMESLGFEFLSAFVIETSSFRGVCQSSCHLPSLPLKPSSSSKLFIIFVYSILRRHILDTQGSSLIIQQLSVIDLHYWELLHFKRSVREVAELYGCEKSLPVVEAHRSLSGLHSIALSALERQGSHIPYSTKLSTEHISMLTKLASIVLETKSIFVPIQSEEKAKKWSCGTQFVKIAYLSLQGAVSNRVRRKTTPIYKINGGMQMVWEVMCGAHTGLMMGCQCSKAVRQASAHWGVGWPGSVWAFIFLTFECEVGDDLQGSWKTK